jgi:hypothetical protein
VKVVATEKNNMIQVENSNLEQINNQQQEEIMTKIIESKKRPFWHKKNLIRIGLLVSLVLVISFTIILLKDQSEFSVEDFYQNVVMYEERITEIIDEKELELSYQNGVLLKELDEELLTNLRREELQEVYLASEFDIVYTDYLGNLSTTQDFMETIIQVVESQKNIKLEEAFYPSEDNPDLMYRFLMNDEANIVIERNDGIDFAYIKMGLNQNLLSYDECHYAYDLDQEILSIANALIYNDFRFIEDKEAFYVNSSPKSSSLRYTSIETGTQFTISYGNALLEGENYQSEGYVLNYYNSIDNFRVYLQTVDSTIVSETYEVFNEHGTVYRLEDNNVGDSVYEVTTNIVMASGWDYALVSYFSSDEIDSLKGIYLDDGTQLFQGHLGYAFTDNSAYIGYSKDFNGEIDQSTFSLESIGLSLEDETYTYEFFDRIHIDSFEKIEAEFQIEGLDFFSSDLRYQLYHYLDQDIRGSIEGDSEVEVASGDTSELLHALDLYSSNFSGIGSVIQVTDSTLSLYDNEDIVGTIPTRVSLWLDLNQMYYRQSTESYGEPYKREDIYIQVIDQSLIRFYTHDQILEYELISNKPTQSDFLDVTNIVFSGDPLLGMEKIIAISDYEFSIDVNMLIFSTDADMDIVFQQLGISGLDEATMKLTIDFSEDFSSYTQEILIEGLIVDQYDASYLISTTSTVSSFTLQNPLDNQLLYMFLPQGKEDIIITSPVNQQVRYYMNEGESSWIRVYLEPGDYSTNIYGNMTSVTYEIYNTSGSKMEEDYSTHIDELGYYYYKITTPYEQSIEFSVQKITLPTDYNVTFDEFGGNFALDYIDSYSIYHFTTPIFENDMIMIVTVNKPGVEGEWLFLEMEDHFLNYNYSLNQCNLSSTVETCYFYVPSNSTDLITFRGLYEGEVDFDYQFVDFSYFETDVTVANLDDTGPLLILPDNYEASVIFSVDDSFTSKISVNVIGIYSSYIDIALYDMEGSKLSNAVNRSSYDFMPGTYKIVIYFSYYTDFPQLGIVTPYFPK